MEINQYKFCHFFLVRHGETEWNTQRIMQGHKDSPLTKNGINQAKKVSQLLKDVRFDHVFSSDLMRAQRTAEIIAANHDVVVKTNQLLRESKYGRFEGKKLAYFLHKLRTAIAYRQSLSQVKKMKYKIHPDIESYEEVATRMITFLRQLALAYLGKNILLVTHSGTIRATLIKMGFATDETLPHGTIKNAGYVVLKSDGVDFFVTKTVGIKLNSQK